MRVGVIASVALALAGFAGAAPPTVSFTRMQAAPGDALPVRVAGLRPGRARLVLVPGGVALNPAFRTSRRGTTRFRATIPNVLPRVYRLSVVRNGREVVRSSRALRIVDPPPRIRGCEDSVYGDLGRDWEQRAIRVGPVAFIGARNVAADDVARHKAVKVLVVVDNGTAVTLRVVGADRKGVALDYTGRAAKRVADGMPAMTFRACDRGDWRPHTQFNGAFVLDRPRCAHLAVRVEGRADPILAALSFGASC